MPGKKDKDRHLWSEGESDVAVEDEQELSRPKRYKVLLLNDDYTTMEFVVQVLMDVFHHSEERAIEIMLHVHHNGVGLAGVYSHEVAETKVNKVTELARQNEYPLRCQMEPE
jgi:ATP-dependent Clp protease adaptor protein ClpS